MIYLFDEAIPINTLPATPCRYELAISRGLIYRIEITFPPGSFGLAGVRIFDGGFQVWPSTPGSWFRGDNVKIDFDDLYLKESAPYLFLIEAYNRDTQWSHTIFVRIGVSSKKAFQARFLPTVAYEYYQQMLSDIYAEQQKAAEQQQYAAAQKRERVLQTPIIGGS